MHSFYARRFRDLREGTKMVKRMALRLIDVSTRYDAVNSARYPPCCSFPWRLFAVPNCAHISPNSEELRTVASIYWG